ncbi:hypothetical protein MTBBW1_2380048 [Desulfamplus magnetovallimortis]|uniref:Tetratricopeptide repeat protein n=2 Tax=Desulfamplus magnetovallimortis TaxID=1246637 RepID=A0A1W1HE00_9BACT|nr:hypothetical protein MTBBW1_2380048 [Desulfamplus magnetovallimortis]
MGNIYVQLLNFDMAFKYWEVALNKEPGLSLEIKDYQRKEADYWLERGRTEPSIMDKAMTRALQLCREEDFIVKAKNVGWQRSSAMLNTWINKHARFKDAELFLCYLEPLRGLTPEWDYLMGRLCSQKGDIENALVHVEDALKYEFEEAEKPKDYPSWIGLSARLFLENNRFEEGIKRLQEAVEMDKNQAVLWEELGDTLFGMQDYTTSAIAYEKCYIAMPDRHDILKKFGDCYCKMGEIEAARAAYQAVLEKDSSNEAAKKALDEL